MMQSASILRQTHLTTASATSGNQGHATAIAPIFLENEEQEIQCKEKQGRLTAKSLGKAGQTSQKKPGRAYTLVPLLPVLISGGEGFLTPDFGAGATLFRLYFRAPAWPLCLYFWDPSRDLKLVIHSACNKKAKINNERPQQLLLELIRGSPLECSNPKDTKRHQSSVVLNIASVFFLPCFGCREESDKPGRLGAVCLQCRDFRVGPRGLGDAPQRLPLPSGGTGKPG
ncbi:unnamed protein product [Arctogadus glacialis]